MLPVYSELEVFEQVHTQIKKGVGGVNSGESPLVPLSKLSDNLALKNRDTVHIVMMDNKYQ